MFIFWFIPYLLILQYTLYYIILCVTKYFVTSERVKTNIKTNKKRKTREASFPQNRTTN